MPRHYRFKCDKCLATYQSYANVKRCYCGGHLSRIGTPGQELVALRELREVCGMYCEQLPVEVREVLHKVPEIEKTHGCTFGSAWEK